MVRIDVTQYEWLLGGLCSYHHRRSYRSPLFVDDACTQSAFFILQGTLGIQHARQLKQASHEASPASLMTGAKTRTVVAVEIFVEKNMVPPVRIFLKLLGASVDRSPAAAVAEEDARQSPRKFHCHLKQC